MPQTTLDELGFKFAIGDILIHRGASHVKEPNAEDKQAFLRDRPSPADLTRFVVLERHAVECHGGVQRLYLVNACDARTGDCAAQYMRLSETELTQAPASA